MPLDLDTIFRVEPPLGVIMNDGLTLIVPSKQPSILPEQLLAHLSAPPEIELEDGLAVAFYLNIDEFYGEQHPDTIKEAYEERDAMMAALQKTGCPMIEITDKRDLIASAIAPSGEPLNYRVVDPLEAMERAKKEWLEALSVLDAMAAELKQNSPVKGEQRQ